MIFKINQNASTNVIHYGNEKIPVIVIDNFYHNHQALIDYAAKGNGFHGSAADFYPGLRQPLPENYANQIGQHYLPLIEQIFQLPHATTTQTILSAYSIATTTPTQLRPIQTLPHFDSPRSNQLAVVHYLCDSHHGGTSFYRHRTTGFESINQQRLTQYGCLLKQQAIESQLHKNLYYINGDHLLFEQVYQVEAQMNRAIIYPSNALHSGNIQPQLGLSGDPYTGRLTTSSFILVK